MNDNHAPTDRPAPRRSSAPVRLVAFAGRPVVAVTALSAAISAPLTTALQGLAAGHPVTTLAAGAISTVKYPDNGGD